MNPQDVAKIAINGLLSGKKMIIPGNINNIFLLMNRIVPHSVKALIISKGMRSNENGKSGISKN